MTDFFLSYTGVDRPWAEWIAWQLEEAGYTTVIQAWDFRPGGNFALDMQAAAAESERTIAVLSSAYLQSGFSAAGWAAAFATDPTGAQRLLVPVRIGDCEPRGLLPQIVYIGLLGLEVEAARDMLLAGVQRQRAKPTTAPGFPGQSPRRSAEQPRFPGSPPPPHNIPFLGSGHFVGRQDALEALHRDLTRTDRVSISAIAGMGGTITAAAPPVPEPGDLDGDSDVDQDDLGIVVNCFGQFVADNPACAIADVAPPPGGDGVINILDVSFVGSNFTP